ncbi:glutaredoxin family protein [Thauera sp. 2A1]|uniref:glutaredoxin family protein n=1 Tax=Thauera sp. 2A1 TaxID=2570191 RepID=UPI001D172B2B|nr:glutaredoxin family protein [Thauera sp. 2A1]KAI5915672.1 glutaredoxin family protein [Thauera sp. 2A1]
MYSVRPILPVPLRGWLLALLLAMLLPWPSIAAGAAVPSPGEVQVEQPVLEVFVREGCPHCADAKVFLAQLAAERPDLQIRLRPVDRDPAAREDLIRISREADEWPPGVPTFVFNGQVLVGFDDAGHSGAELRALIGKGPRAAAGKVDTALFGTLSASRLGLPVFTLAIGLLDGFNPCAMWVLLFLLSLLVRLHDRRRMALIAGTFVLASGAVYYAFMAAWLNVFLLVGMTDALRLGLAAVAIVIGAINVKDFFALRQGVSLSIPAAAKPGIYVRVRAVLKAESLLASLLGVAVLAVVVNFVELLCTAGLPAIYTAVLTQQGLSPLAHYAYLGLYNLAYIADDSLMVAAAVLALGSGKLTERGGRVLKLVAGAVMLALGVVMALRPEWLI